MQKESYDLQKVLSVSCQLKIPNNLHQRACKLTFETLSLFETDELNIRYKLDSVIFKMSGRRPLSELTLGEADSHLENLICQTQGSGGGFMINQKWQIHKTLS